MYRVLVVDDEKIGRDGISFLLRKSSIDFEIAEAHNGKMALDYIKNHDIQFLLTDIKMPFMDGIDLIREVKKLNLHIKIVILSGYSDFEYAKSAMKMGVSEYILKPIDPSEFMMSMESIVQDYITEQKQLQNMQRHMFLLKEHILYSLVNGSSLHQIEKKLNHSLKDFIQPYRRIFLLEFSHNFFGETFDIVDQLNKVIPIEYDSLNLNLQQSLLFFHEDHENKLQVIAKQIIQNISIIYNRRCYIAISKRIEDISQIYEIELMLEDLMESRYLHPQIQLYKHDDILKNIETKNVEEIISRMDQSIKLKDMNAFKNDFYLLQEIYCQNENYSIDYLKFLLSSLLKNIHQILVKTSQYDVDLQLSRFYHCHQTKALFTILLELIDELEQVYNRQENFVHKEIEAVKKYIYSYYNLDLSVDQLADYVCLAPSYLSHIFKKETGENLSKFIKRVRMEKAKDMLENSYEKIVTISVAVGYQNVSYFCQSFREYFGISPQKFRSQGE